jgi:hypothetical protein
MMYYNICTTNTHSFLFLLAAPIYMAGAAFRPTFSGTADSFGAAPAQRATVDIELKLVTTYTAAIPPRRNFALPVLWDVLR